MLRKNNPLIHQDYQPDFKNTLGNCEFFDLCTTRI